MTFEKNKIMRGHALCISCPRIILLVDGVITYSLDFVDATFLVGWLFIINNGNYSVFILKSKSIVMASVVITCDI